MRSHEVRVIGRRSTREDTAETVQMEADKRGLGEVTTYQVTVGPPSDLVVVALFYGPIRVLNTIAVRMNRPWSKWMLRRAKTRLQRKADKLNHAKASLIAEGNYGGSVIWEGSLIRRPRMYQSVAGDWEPPLRRGNED